MATAKETITDANLKKLVQRQLLLLSSFDENNPSAPRPWPGLWGLSERESMAIFEILERWGWVAGYPGQSGEFVCIITPLGSDRLTRVKGGQSLIGSADLAFRATDRKILAAATTRIGPPRSASGSGQKWIQRKVSSISSWVHQRVDSKFGMLFVIVLIPVLFGAGAYIKGLEEASLQYWSTLATALGGVVVGGGFSVPFQRWEKSKWFMRWIPLLIAIPGFALVILVSLLNDDLGIYFDMYVASAVGLAMISLSPRS